MIIPYFTLPNKIVTNLSGNLTDNIRFENAIPQKPEGWETNSWKINK